jgi:hypothetical protein
MNIQTALGWMSRNACSCRHAQLHADAKHTTGGSKAEPGVHAVQVAGAAGRTGMLQQAVQVDDAAGRTGMLQQAVQVDAAAGSTGRWCSRQYRSPVQRALLASTCTQLPATHWGHQHDAARHVIAHQLHRLARGGHAGKVCGRPQPQRLLQHCCGVPGGGGRGARCSAAREAGGNAVGGGTLQVVSCTWPGRRPS